MAAYSAGNYAAPTIDEVVPFVIQIVYPLLSKFIYVSPNVIIKGRVEELLAVNLGNYGIAVAEDCSKRLSTYINLDVLDAVQRSASKPWVSETPYAKNACIPELGMVLIDLTKLEKDLLEAILWWSKVLNRSERSSPNPAVALALHNRHLKLPHSWRVGSLIQSEKTLVLRYGNGRNVCSLFGSGTISQPDFRDIVEHYLPPGSDRILGS
ncbi:unnamed protein product [Ilex paraguariensis]|uniref:Hexosyltransferase n=1 Tax=Ilex paraguariensis TaxID=185542 RepID=A0ABC8S2P2_9AQUA